MFTKKCLSALPTSVANEQLFSPTGKLYTDRRNNAELLFLAYNIGLFGFNY